MAALPVSPGTRTATHAAAAATPDEPHPALPHAPLPQHATAAPLLQVDGLRKRYGSTDVLRGLSFQLQPHETLALIGPSGSGKSTCLRCVNLLERPDEGHVVLDGEVIGRRPTPPGQV